MNLLLLALLAVMPLHAAQPAPAEATVTAVGADPLPDMERALARAKTSLPGGTEPLSYLAYVVTETRSTSVGTSMGALQPVERSTNRWLDIDLRVGDHHLDSTHKLRGGFSWTPRADGTIPRADAGVALHDALILGTDDVFRAARKSLVEIRTNEQIKVAPEDNSDDFSPAPVVTHVAPPAPVRVDVDAWAGRIATAAARLAAQADVHDSGVGLDVEETQRWFLDSEGRKIVDGRARLRVFAWAVTTAEDGMQLQSYDYVDVGAPEHLPDASAFDAMVDEVARTLQALRKAPIVEPYEGPAILRGRAAGVFFHEIFGHRIEGHRQKDEDEGQTFTKRVNESVLPAFLSVVDDPTLTTLGGVDLNGHYVHDDEGVAAERVVLVENGILRNFLMGRSPVKGFPRSNGHGRRETGNDVVPRQGNLIVQASTAVPYAKLREQLVAEVKKQGKPYGLVFDDISGGFTFTGRSTPNAFAVQPVTVWRVFPDGRPDELVRGVDLIGTPLTTFGRIVAAANDRDVFNGVCGAESGWVPVSASSPSLLVSTVEVQRTEKGVERPPILPAPTATPVPTTAGGAR